MGLSLGFHTNVASLAGKTDIDDMQKPTKLLITCRTTSYRACSKELTEKQMANCQRKGLHNHVWRNGKPRINCAMPWCTVAVLQEECQGATWTFMQDSIAATTICSCHRRQKSITYASSTSSWFGGTAFMLVFCVC